MRSLVRLMSRCGTVGAKDARPRERRLVPVLHVTGHTMRTRLLLGALLIATGLACTASSPRRLYRVTWASAVAATPEGPALTAQFDRQLRDELQRRGAILIDSQDPRAAIILRPNLSVTARGLELNLAGVRSADQQLLGSVSMKATGSSRNAQVEALVKRACVEADRFE